jgi:signal transduction histidine kinase/ActR/RegA family two-component response regulator
MNPGTRRKRALMLALPLLTLLLLGAVYAFAGLMRDSRRVERSDEIQLTLERLERSLADAQGGQRGYFASGDRRFLETYDRARLSTWQEFDRVSELSNPEQQPQLAKLKDLVGRRLDDLEATRAAYDGGTRNRSLATLMVEGKKIMDPIRLVIADMQREEHVLSLQRQRDEQAHARWTLLLLSGAISVFSFVVAAIWTQHQRAERELARQITEGLQRDVNEQKKTQVRLRDALTEIERARQDAEAANRSKDEFLAMLGHELRNPLSPITTGVFLLKRRGFQFRELDVIERQTRHLTRLVDELLDVSRLTRGKVTLSREAIALRDIVAAAIEMASPPLENGQHLLIANVSSPGLIVDVDRVRMAQVFANLLSNAAKYTPAGGRIHLAAAREGGEVVVSVHDTGIGISADLLPHVFDSFVQDSQTLARSQGGLGLGLAIVKSLVTMHGGSVSARSDGPGRGSTFTVRLPAIDMPPKTQEASSPLPAIAPTHMRVLVVDDNVDGAQMLAEALDALGYRTAVAHDGPQALHVEPEFAPHVALLDIGLPVMDGYELAGRLHEQRQDLKLVAITGYGQNNDLERTRAAGFEEHLTKPVDLDKLGKTLSRLFETLVSTPERVAG